MSVPPQPCAAAPGDGGVPRGPTPPPAKIVPRPSLQKVTAMLGAGRGPALARALRAARIGCRSGGQKSSWKKGPRGPPWGFLLLPGGPKGSCTFSCALTDTEPLGIPRWHSSQPGMLVGSNPCSLFALGGRKGGSDAPDTPSCSSLDAPGQIIPGAAPPSGAGSPSRGRIPSQPHQTQASTRALHHPRHLPGDTPPVGSHLPAPPALTPGCRGPGGWRGQGPWPGLGGRGDDTCGTQVLHVGAGEVAAFLGALVEAVEPTLGAALVPVLVVGAAEQPGPADRQHIAGAQRQVLLPLLLVLVESPVLQPVRGGHGHRAGHAARTQTGIGGTGEVRPGWGNAAATGALPSLRTREKILSVGKSSRWGAAPDPSSPKITVKPRW